MNRAPLQSKQKRVFSQHEWRAADRTPGGVTEFFERAAEISGRCCSQISYTVDSECSLLFEGLITLHSLLERELNIRHVKDVQEQTLGPDVWRYSQLLVYSWCLSQGSDRIGPELPF